MLAATALLLAVPGLIVDPKEEVALATDNPEEPLDDILMFRQQETDSRVLASQVQLVVFDFLLCEDPLLAPFSFLNQNH